MSILLLNAVTSVFAQKKIDSINLITLKAIELKKENKIEDAITTLKKIIEIKTTKSEEFNSKIQGLMLLCDYSRLSNELEKNIAFEKEITSLALTCSNNAIKLFPKVADGYFNRGKLNIDYLNKTDSALKDFDAYILLNKNNIEAYKYRLAIYKLPKYLSYNKLANDYSQLIRLDTNNTRSYYENRAECYLKLNKIELAILDYTFLINTYKDLKYNEQRGDLYVQLKKYQLGINDYTIIIKNRMTKREIRIKRANAYFDNNSLDTAYYEYTNIKMEFDMASMNKEIANVINKKYGAKLTQLDIDKSDKFLDIAKNDILWPYQLKTEDDKKYYNQIKEALTNSIKADPYQYNAYLWMAEIEFTIANYDAAKKNYLAAHEIMPLNPEFLFRANKSEAAKTK
jgi:tetratricopeptide (TPR) repeat protein